MPYSYDLKLHRPFDLNGPLQCSDVNAAAKKATNNDISNLLI